MRRLSHSIVGLTLLMASSAQADNVRLEDISHMMRLNQISVLVGGPGGQGEIDNPPAPSDPGNTDRGAAINYRTGRAASTQAGQPAADWFYPNGRVATYDAGKPGADWYYPNGSIATYDAGVVGGTWYWPNGRIATADMGEAGADWYYSDGQLMTYDGPAMSAVELLDAPKIILWMLWLDGKAGPPF